MYGCESWTIKKAECQRIDAFELWCWGRLLRVPWTTRRSKQYILKEISPEYSLEGLMLKLETLILWSPDVKNWLIWKDLMQGKIEGGRRRERQRMRWLDGITDFMDIRLSKITGGGNGQRGLVCYSPWDCKESDRTEQLNWTENHYMTQQYHFLTYTLKKAKLKRDTCTPMFIAALFTIAKTWKQARCLLT